MFWPQSRAVSDLMPVLPYLMFPVSRSFRTEVLVHSLKPGPSDWRCSATHRIFTYLTYLLGRRAWWMSRLEFDSCDPYAGSLLVWALIVDQLFRRRIIPSWWYRALQPPPATSNKASSAHKPTSRSRAWTSSATLGGKRKGSNIFLISQHGTRPIFDLQLTATNKLGIHRMRKGFEFELHSYSDAHHLLNQLFRVALFAP